MNTQGFKDQVQTDILEVLKLVFDPDDNFNLTPEDIINLTAGDINKVVDTLKKLIKLLPVTPIDSKELKEIYKHTSQVLASA